jgi:tRNA threonylcarbamoyladenosine biosynthesis protein TsaB
MILSLDTTTRQGSVAVVDKGETRFLCVFPSERSHNSALFEPLREALAIARPSLRAIVVGTGPGSYTGARVGITAGLGLSLAHDIPLLGRNSLHGLVHEDGSPVLQARFLGNARRGLWFLVQIADGSPREEPILIGEEELTTRLLATEEMGPLVATETPPAFLSQTCSMVRPDAARLAMEWSHLASDVLRGMELQPVEPLYLQDPYITPARNSSEPRHP